MHDYVQSILNLFNAEYVVTIGYWLMTVVVFVETGLLIGFCLPGDSLLVTAGIFAASGKLDIWTINALLIPAAILGDTLGYWIGYHSGPRLYKREKSLLFNPEHLRAAQDFYTRHGGKTIILARFVPIVRTFAPVVAGMGRMDYRRFLLFNVFGGVGWVLSMSMLGYCLSLWFPQYVNAKKIETVVVVVVLISVLPIVVGYLMKRFGKTQAAQTKEPIDA